MATLPVTNLAGTQRGTPPRTLKLSIGRKGDRGYPEKLGYIQIQRPAKDATKGRYVCDEELQKALVALCGDQQPKWVPIFVWDNDVSRFLVMRRSFYQGGKCLCSCGEFRAKTESECRADGLAWPPPGAFHELPEAYLVGMATWKQYRKQGEALVMVGSRLKVCNPSTCPFATGRMAELEDDDWRQRMTEKHDGQKLCKPQIILSCQLDLPDVRIGTFAKFVSTGWRTAQYLAASLEVVRTMTGGNLMGIPLRLCYAEEVGDTPMGRQKIPYLYVESNVPLRQLPDETNRVLQLLAGNRQMVKQLQAHTVEVIDAEFTPAAERAFAEEFHHETVAEAVIDVEPEEIVSAPTDDQLREAIRDLAAQTGRYTPAWVDGQLSSCATTNDLLSLQDLLQRELRRPDPGGMTPLFPAEGDTSAE